MSTTIAQRRKGGGGNNAAIATIMDPMPESNIMETIDLENNGVNESNDNPRDALKNMVPASPVVTATVRRNLLGTGPFDRYWLNLDPCGLLCAAFTYFLHFFGAYAVCCVLIPPWMSYTINEVRSLSLMGHFTRCTFAICTALAIISHFKAMTTDPGAVPPDAKPLPDIDAEQADVNNTELLALSSSSLPKRLCRRCKTYKPQRAHHCSICRRCIIKMDHHCPWVNNCVGIGNHKYFLLFVMYTLFTCSSAVILIVARFASCMGDRRGYVDSSSHSLNDSNSSSLSLNGNHHHRYHHRHMHMTCLDHPTQLLTILGLLVESILFGMFTCCMIFDQLEVIRSKLTHIDRLKGSSVGGSLEGIIEVFGLGNNNNNNTNTSPNFRLDWLSPFVQVCFPPSLRDEVMGFCQNACCGNSNDTHNRSNSRRSHDGTIQLSDVI